jgi:HTH-type transcriptional regulator, sugar sensing transcriptional regulator
MQIEILRKIGLTEGEIRVYGAVVKLGKSSTGPIMEKCGISSSKVYLILNKLIEKGLVTFTIENNVKIFIAANPINIIEYINQQKEELEKTKSDAKNLVKDINKLIGSNEEEIAKVYKGKKSLRTTYQNIFDNLNQDFLFIGAPSFELDSLEVFFQNLQLLRQEKKIKTLGIADISTQKRYTQIFKGKKNIKLKFIDFPFPHAIAIGKDRIIISMWEPLVIGFEIESKRITERYRKFFYSLWNKK